MIGDCQTLVHLIIPYHYLIAEESCIKRYSEYNKSISLTITESINLHLDKTEKRLLNNHESTTKHSLDLLSNYNDSIDLDILIQELQLSRNNLHDSLLALLTLRLKAEQLLFIANNTVLLPVRNRTHAKMFFSMDGSGSDTRLISHNFFSYNTQSEQLALCSELFSDYFGPVRFGFGALMTNGQTDTEQNEIMI